MSKAVDFTLFSLRNWKSTLLGVGGLLVAVGHALVYTFDGDPNTDMVLSQFINEVMLALGLIVVRDADKTSEQTGLK